MKLNLRKVAIPVIIAGVIIYGGSKIGKIKYNEDYNNTTNQIIIDTNNTSDSKIEDKKEENVTIPDTIPEESVVDMDNLVETESPEEKEEEQEIKVRKIDGTEIETRKVVKAESAVNIRKAADTESEKLAVLAAGKTLDYISTENEDWYKVNYNGEDAYVSAKFVNIDEETRVNAELQKMVCFKNDSKLYKDLEAKEELGDIPELEAAEVYGESNGYYLASVDNKVGYIKKEDTQDLKNTFVIVDISDQTAYLYEGNEMIISTPVVTGKLDTPTTKGLHEVWYIENNRFLKGEGYNVYVDYYMAFHNGEGLHDASYHTHYNKDGSIAFSHGWRSETSFGGKLYENGGSHGCVNMPHDATKTISEHIEIGDKVLVKQ